MADKASSLTDLPLDILVLVFPYLDAKSFLALCSTCKAFQQPSIRLDPAYWSFATRSTFRIPNQPVVQHDGVRWQKMFRRLLTQSHVFTWGSNTHNRLGHSYEERAQPRQHSAMSRTLLRARPARRAFNANCSFPTEMEDTRSLGVIADMQCGGWSTTLLTAKGSLHTVGVLDGYRVLAASERLQPLRFPEGYPSSANDAQYLEPAIAIRQFSAGRSHILALSDSGKIWSWYHAKKPALQVKFADVEVKELSLKGSSTPSATYGQVAKVIAGWSRSSALIHGIGIVVWDPVERDHGDEGSDTMLVMENTEVPKTIYQRIKGNRESDEERALGEEVGVVQSYVMLEHFVVFATDNGKVFCGKFGEKNKIENIIELRQLRNEKGAPLDVQGSFRSFAVFKNDDVITTDQNYLEACWNAQQTDPEQADIQGLKKIPALQHNDVISVAFGDYHYLALHSNGKITSYGTEIGGCGALGLGDQASSTGQARGIVYDRFSHNSQLVPHAYTHGRQVWFDARKKDWIDHVVHGRTDPDESRDRRSLFNTDHDVQGEVSEWLEQESRGWDQDGGEDGLGAYFALRVSAAGWHSGALVLVNEELANKEPAYERENKPFPRLRLADGTEMPGEKEFDEWREGRPNFELNTQT
ncbi:RCC1/BLIP-II [Clathrospora elynae]|uniref:RCC1/BLIP-II n=1 Tax=Clathrospora elynae TaxID=706981 RepID=A0A6A5SGJ5_9PLEO|nr:RCC1/BLIP-II [Clathrospora elynae]